MAGGEVNSLPGEKDFEGWLSARLNQIGLDEEVFGSYVTGLMDAEDSTDEERTEGLTAILVGNTEHSIEDLCEEILSRWKMSRAEVLQKQKEEKEQTAATKKDKLTEIMEKQASTIAASKTSHTKVDPNLKKQLMAQYAHQSDEEQYGDSDGEAGDSVKANTTAQDIFKNENVQSVMKSEKDKRDKMKQENEQKKQQIKEAREKQRQKAEERKEKEKKRTQKGERRMR